MIPKTENSSSKEYYKWSNMLKIEENMDFNYMCNYANLYF